MKKLIYVACFLALCVAAPSLSAQRVIELNKSKLDAGKRRFNITQVIDARFDTVRLGVARVGMSNRKEAILLSERLDVAFLRYFTDKLPRQEELPDVVVRVSRFGWWEETDFESEGARVAADFEFYLKKNDGYAFLGDRKFRYTEGYGSNVTKYHDDNLRAALQDAVNFLQDSVEWKDTEKLTANLSQDSISKRTTLRILTDSAWKVGGYKNFTDFRNNNPRIEIKSETDGDKKVLLIEGKKDKFRRVKPGDKLWGFYDGKDLYINQHGRFFPLRKNGALFLFYGLDVDQAASNAAIGGATFGLIGGLIAGAMTKSRDYMVDWETGAFLERE